MSWTNYYNLYEKYSGDLSKATEEELRFAARCNPNTPWEAQELGRRKYLEKLEKEAPFPVHLIP